MKIQEIIKENESVDLIVLQKEYNLLKKKYGSFCPMPVVVAGGEGDNEVVWLGKIDFPELKNECDRIKELYYLIQDLENKQNVNTDADTDPDGGFSRFDTDF